MHPTNQNHPRPHKESSHKRSPLPGLLYRKHRRSILLQREPEVSEVDARPLLYSALNKFYRPAYELGIWSMIVSHLIEAVIISILGLLLRWENQKRDKMQSQMEGGLEGRDLDATAFLDLTDRENLKYVISLVYLTDRVLYSC